MEHDHFTAFAKKALQPARADDYEPYPRIAVDLVTLKFGKSGETTASSRPTPLDPTPVLKLFLVFP